MLSIYPACFYKEKEGGYSVLFPDFSGGTCGDTVEEAMTMAVDYLAGVLYDIKCNKETAPAATSLSEVEPDKLYNEYESVFVNMITVDVDEYAKKHFEKSVKKTLTIPAWLNEKAIENNINFSSVLREALENRLNIR